MYWYLPGWLFCWLKTEGKLFFFCILMVWKVTFNSFIGTYLATGGSMGSVSEMDLDSCVVEGF